MSTVYFVEHVSVLSIYLYICANWVCFCANDN